MTALSFGNPAFCFPNRHVPRGAFNVAFRSWSAISRSLPQTVKDSFFIGNVASDGGGIYDLGGTQTVKDSFFIGNVASDGGGIYDTGTLVNSKNVFFDNTGEDIYS